MAGETKTRDCTPSELRGLADEKSSPRMRRSRTSWKRAAFLIGIHVVFALHLWHLEANGQTISPLEPSEAMEFSKHSVVNAGLVFFLATTLITLLFGRFFCGWGCHLVALQDLCRAMLLKVGIRPRPLRSRLLAFVPAMAFVYMFIWPLVARLWLKKDILSSTQVELQTSDFWATFPGLGVTILTFLVCGFLVVYLLGAKGYCTYACPYGALYYTAERFSPGRIRVTDACEGCGHCTATCSSNVQVSREVREYGMVVDPGCMKCLDCVSVCPKDALYMGFGKPAFLASPRIEASQRRPRRHALGWGEELLLAVVFLGAFLSFRGLYPIPFLLSLGIAGAVAFTVLQLTRLLRRKKVELPGWTVASGESMKPAGWLFVVLGGGVLILWISAALARWPSYQSAKQFQSLAPVRESWFGPQSEEARAQALPSFERMGRAARRALDSPWLDDPRQHYQLAWSHLAQGDAQGFLKEAELAQKGGLARSDFFLDLARVQRSLGNSAQAEKFFTRVLDAHPDLPAAWAGLAECLALRGEVDAARNALEQGRRLAPKEARLAHDLAVIETMSGNLPHAIELLRESLELDPKFQEARVKLATLLEAAGAPEEARRVLEEGDLERR